MTRSYRLQRTAVDGGVADLGLLVAGQHRQLVPVQRFLDAIGKPHTVGMLQISRGADHDADRTTGMQNLAVLAEDFDQRHDLRADRVDQVRMVVDSISHLMSPAWVLRDSSLPKERRVVILHRQFKVVPHPPPPGHHLLAGDRVFGGPLVLFPVQPGPPLLPQGKVVEVDAVLEQQFVLARPPTGPSSPPSPHRLP